MKNTILLRLALTVFLLSLTSCANKLINSTTRELDEFLSEPVNGEIILSCFDDNGNFLKPAIDAFCLRYPNVKVTIQKFSPDIELNKQEINDVKSLYTTRAFASGQEKLDYIRRLNTELMSGRGADILQVDIIPWYKYADMGCIEDLSPLILNDSNFDKDVTRRNILDATLYKKKYFILPLDFMFYFYAFDASFFNNSERQIFEELDTFTFEDMIRLSEPAFLRNKKQNSIFGVSGCTYHSYHVFKILLRQHYLEFVNIPAKQVFFDDGRFERLLLSVNEYLENGYIQETTEIIEDFVRYDIGIDYKERIKENRFLCKYEQSGHLMQNFSYALVGNNYSLLPTYGDVNNDLVAGLASDNTGNVEFWSPLVYALNANSKNKRTAWEFLKFLATDEPQTFSQLNFVPINKMLLRDNIEARLTLFDRKPELFSKDTNADLEAYLSCVEEYSDRINTYIIHDVQIDMMIEEEVSQYFDCKKSAKEAAEALQNKASLYFTE